MKYLKLSLVIIWMIIIFNFSNQPATDSSKLSDGLILKSVRIIEKVLDKKFDDEEILNNFVKPVRKLAHFTIYLLLGILVLNYINEFNLNKYVLISFIICFIYAISDELHQLFIPGRSCEIFDVCIDSLGSFIGINIFKKINRKKQIL